MKTTAHRFSEFFDMNAKRFGESGKRSRRAKRGGYTLLEILVSVSLMLLLMFAVAKIFSRVGSIINDTQRTMELANNIRNVRNRLDSDLKSLTAPLTPPLNSSAGQGYFCYMEGLGAPLQRVHNDLVSGVNPKGIHETGEIALDGDRGQGDNTLGDVDDILMFTAQAPPGDFFRGRFGGKAIESEFAEIVWFVRGTTLYRRVLLIVPNELLQNRLNDANFMKLVDDENSLKNSGETPDSPRTGQAFFKYFDVSVHSENGQIVANTLGDLSNRKNRFGFWSSYFAGNSGSISGTYGAWYWLRLPTLWETASSNFVAGTPMGGFDALITCKEGDSATLPLSTPDSEVKTPFIDYWLQPNVWNGADETDPETGNLTHFKYDDSNLTVKQNGFNQDVLMTNVLSFNVRVWNPDLQKYIDLGVDGSTLGNRTGDNERLLSTGFYGNTNYLTVNNGSLTEFRPYVPCVYDTWSEQYQREYLNYCLENNIGSISNRTIGDIPLNGKIDSEVLDVFPPPYRVPLKGIQVEIRAFDPRSKSIKNMTLELDLSR